MKKFSVCSVALALSVATSIAHAADVSPDGGYRMAGASNSMWTQLFTGGGLDNVGNISLFSQEHWAIPKFLFDSSLQTLEFNVSDPRAEAWSEAYVEYWLGGPTSGEVYHSLDAGQDDPAVFSFTGDYVPIDNLVTFDLSVNDDGEIENERFPVMFAADENLFFTFALDGVADQEFCAECGAGGVTISSDERYGEMIIGLKSGGTENDNSKVNGTYFVMGTASAAACTSGVTGSETTNLPYNENCSNLDHYVWRTVGRLTFNGAGGCTINKIVDTEGVRSYDGNSFTTTTLGLTEFSDTNIPCSYAVGSTVDPKNQLTVTIAPGTVDEDIVRFKVSMDGRYAHGNDNHSGLIRVDPSQGEWDYDNANVVMMRIDTSLTLGDFTGTYLGGYSGFEVSESTTEPVLYDVGRFALTFDGSGSCSFKEYLESASLLTNAADHRGSQLQDSKEMYEAGYCAYSIDPTSSNRKVQIFIGDDAGSAELAFTTGVLSDNGNTLMFESRETDNPSDPGYLYLNFGLAAKYDGTISEEAIGTWIGREANEPRDLGGDGKADIVIRNTSGQLYLYEMDGNIRNGSNIGALDPVWSVVAIADLGGDGKGDLVLRNTSTGQLYLWEMDGNAKTPSNIGGLSLDWAVVGAEDFGGDGKADLLLRHTTTGQLYLFEMDGNIKTPSNIGALDPIWDIVGLGDLGGDGKADIVIRNTSTGQLYLYEMDGNVRTGSNIGALSTVWNVEGVRDFGGDGKADILLRHSTTGQLYLFEMDGNVKTPSNIGALDPLWNVAQVSDFGGDGKADILLRHSTTGQLYLFEMDGNVKTPSNVGALNTVWNVQ